MTCVVLRFARRKAAWETADAAQIRDIEFKNKNGDYDLRPSVYEVNQNEVVRAFAEHAAAAPIDPPGAALGIDLSQSGFSLKSEPGNPKFCFTKEKHRELVLSTVADLDEVIAWVCKDINRRRTEITKMSVYQYISERLDALDKEWCDLLKSPDAKDWLKKLDAKRRSGTH